MRYALLPFIEMRLKSEIYGSLREKLALPIQVARRIVIRQTLDEQFLVAFTEQVERNGKYRIPSESLVSVWGLVA